VCNKVAITASPPSISVYTLMKCVPLTWSQTTADCLYVHSWNFLFCCFTQTEIENLYFYLCLTLMFSHFVNDVRRICNTVHIYIVHICSILVLRELHCVATLQFAYPFICWWTFVLFSRVGLMSICVKVFVWTYILTSPGQIPRIAWVRQVCYLYESLPNCFPKGVITFYIPTSDVRVLVVPSLPDPYLKSVTFSIL
jgi:hypothetical protein